MIIATAGHIDHGKTSLVKALTGVDTDRLPDEKKRGMSIDLGFAYSSNNNNETLGFVKLSISVNSIPDNTIQITPPNILSSFSPEWHNFLQANTPTTTIPIRGNPGLAK